MSFGKDSSFVFCMQDGVLVNVGRGDVTVDRQPLDSVEEEVWRIFNEHKALQAENKELRKAHWANLNDSRCKVQQVIRELAGLVEDLRLKELEVKKALKNEKANVSTGND